MCLDKGGDPNYNKAERSAMKTAVKKFEAAAADGNRTEAEGAYKVAP